VTPSHRLPVLVFFGAAIHWLVFGLFVGSLASIQLICPEFLDEVPTLTFGRLVPVAINSLVYGWASSAALGVLVWAMDWLARGRRGGVIILTAAAIFWNVGVFLGLCGILAGFSRGHFLLEFPGYTWPILLVALFFTSAWGLGAFQARPEGTVFAAGWYFLGASICFPALLVTGATFLVWLPVAGPAQPAIAAWFVSGVVNLWLAPIALATVLVLLPAVLGRPLADYQWAPFTFWTFSALAGWSGLASLIGGPVPAWMSSSGTVASVLLGVPVFLFARMLVGSVRNASAELGWSAPLRFTVVGAWMFVGAYALGILLALPAVSGVFRFSDVTIAQGFVLLFGFLSMVLFGAVYFIVPRLTGRAWTGGNWMSRHFWLFTVGTSLAIVCLLLGGIIQGFAQADAGVHFTSSTLFAQPFRFVVMLCVLMLLAGAKSFGFAFFSTVLAPGKLPAAKAHPASLV